MLPLPIPGRMGSRFLGILALTVLLTQGLVWIMAMQEARRRVRTEEGRRLAAIATTLAPHLDGELHGGEAPLPAPRAFSTWDEAPGALREARAPLLDAQERNGVETPIYTLRLRPELAQAVRAEPDRVHAEALEFVLTTNPTPWFRDRYDYMPRMAPALVEGRTVTTGVYETAHGRWLSAYAPLHDDEGRVVGLLEVDTTVEELIEAAAARTRHLVGWGLGLGAVAIGIFALLSRRLSRQLAELGCAAQALGAGDHGTPIGTTSSATELRDLARVLESARVRLEQEHLLREETLEQNRVARRRAEETARAQASFLANMSHEIRTPLNGILGLVSVLERTHLDEEQQELVRILRRSGRELFRTLGDLLDLTQLEAGRLVLDPVEFRLGGLVEEVLAEARDQAAASHLAVRSRVEGPLPEKVTGDRGRWRQVLLHLVHNAVKFTDEGSVELAWSADAAGRVRCTVADTGIGIPTDQQVHLFRSFYQVDSSSTRRHGGSGLGLTLARGLVELMGGTLDFESEPGRGSRFTVSLPSREPAGLEPRAPLPCREVARVGARVLVVEDNPVNQLVTRQMLERSGHEVVVAGDGVEALERARAQSFDLVLMDCSMPRMDGHEATVRLRELGGAWQHVPVIALTAHALGEDRDRALASGMDDYLTKPVRREDLEATLARWLHGRARARSA